jgi:CheY-like chemotaxis protein/HAMP domain-containing protein
MGVLKNLSIRSKLFLISVIPSLGLIYLLEISISDSLAKKESTVAVYRDCEQVEKLSDLLNALQVERALYLSYLTTRSDEDYDKIRRHERLTDEAAMVVRNHYDRYKTKSRMLSKIDSLRIFRQTPSSYPDKLNSIKSLLLNDIYHITTGSLDAEIERLLETHLFLLYTKEYFARTKNILLPYFIDKRFHKDEFARFAERKGQYEINREKFLMIAPVDFLEVYRRAFATPSSVEVHATLDSLFINPAFSSPASSADWWTKTSDVLNAFTETENYSLQQIRSRAETQLAEIDRRVATDLVLGVLTLLLIAALVALTIRHIVMAISELKRAAQKLALGEVDFTVNVTSKDELGDLADSFNKMVAVKKLYAETAEKIGKGKYDTAVLVRTSSDILGLALSNMKNDLERLSTENEMRTWMLTGSSKLNDRMRGDKDTSVLANEVISQLTAFLNAQIGALYLRENGHLKLWGRYAFTQDGRSTFAVGDGFVGQAASDGNHIILKDVPEHYIKINSALGNIKPRNIVVYPFKYEGEVKAVAEIGSLKEFSDVDLEFLDMVSDNIGIAVNASQSRGKLKELLEETQRQAEELETQQEELKQSNEELLAKTHLLERSEDELKTQQEELQLSNEELAEKAAMLQEQKENLEFTKRQMEAKAEELELASQYKTEFLSNMSHELRTPLNSILILAQVLMENRNKTLSSKEIKFANTIYNSGNDLLNLINEILDLSKIEAGKMELDVTAFAIEALIQDISNSFDEVARSRKIEFAIRCPGKLKEKVMRSDQQRIAQVLKNFLSNAFKFTSQDGKIQLTVATPEPGTVFRKKTLLNCADIISFTVTDTGIGIPHEKLNIIFDAFQQVDGSTKRQYGGTGLGLSISRELANMLGGEIHVKSEVGAGSNFALFLPAELGQFIPDTPEHTLAIHPANGVKDLPPFSERFVFNDASHYDDQHLITGGDRKILIMEDDVEFSKVLLEFVHERNYKGIIAHQGNIGLSYARHYKPDAIILDMKLPVVDGADVLKKLKSDPELRHIPVQIISGYDFRKSGLELGAIDFIQKPVTREAFWKALDKVEHFVSRKPKKLLIIEDDKQHNQAVKELIGNGDVKCYSAYSGKEAYDLLSTTSFDCIIVDLGLPDMTGLNFLEKIRERDDMNRIPVIVYTGKDLTREEHAELENLANTVVLKTAFSHERLLDETTLFLHRVESKLPKEKQNIIRKLHKTDQVLKNKKVLIVDDDHRNVYSLFTALEMEGLKCLKAGNGKEALQILKQEKSVDIILMDVMMPEMDGFEATTAIRQMPSFKKIPIIALTAKAMKDDREKCLAAGMSDYISKPLNVQQLLSLMRVWLYA